jgi:hypothetical protein
MLRIEFPVICLGKFFDSPLVSFDFWQVVDLPEEGLFSISLFSLDYQGNDWERLLRSGLRRAPFSPGSSPGHSKTRGK